MLKVAGCPVESFADSEAALTAMSGKRTIKTFFISFAALALAVTTVSTLNVGRVPRNGSSASKVKRK